MGNKTEQMLELVLDRLTSIEKNQVGMGKIQESMEKRLEGMEKRQEGMEKRQEGMEKRQDEIFEVVKAIEHSNSMHKAEIDNLTYKMAYVEGTVDGVGEFIRKRKVVQR